MNGTTRHCRDCAWYIPEGLKDERGDGWCTNAGRARYYTVGVTRLKKEGRDRTTKNGTCFHFEEVPHHDP